MEEIMGQIEQDVLGRAAISGMDTVGAWVQQLLGEGYAGRSEQEIATRLAQDGVFHGTVSDDGVKVYVRIVSYVRGAPTDVDYKSMDYLTRLQAAGLDASYIGEQLDASIAISAVKPKPPATPSILVSPTGVIAKNPRALPVPPLAKVPEKKAPEKKEPLKSALDFLGRPAGPLPVYGWGLIGLGAVTVTVIVVVASSMRRGY